MKKKVFSREEAEEKEGMDQVVNEVPSNRQQTTQQVAKVADASNVETPDTSFKMEKTNGKGQTLKQEVISKAITGSSPNAGMGITFAGRSYSGTAGGVLGANNSTPFAEKSRSETRPGKKLDRIATKLNYTPCENVLLDVQESKPLAEAANDDQGYNGTYRNEFARSQKIAGAVPADLLYQRSVDLITKDQLYFVEGQQVFQQAADRTQLNPTTTIDPDVYDEEEQVKDVTYHSGNFVHRAMHAELESDGSVESLFFDVDDITPDNVSAEDANMVSAHRLIKANVAEIDRMNMDAKAGDEKAELWSPLPRAIDQPTAASYLMSSIEADTGAYTHLAYSKATSNMAYQLNRAAKDGLDVVGPAVEQCIGHRTSAASSKDIRDVFGSLQSCFTSANYAKGDPSLMIAAYDSTGKYNSKADLVLQPRGWRMHLQTADNNMNPLKVPERYAQVYAGSEVFSTIDHDYDPIMPVCMTDKANLITVHNMNELGSFVKNRQVKAVSEWTSSAMAAGYLYDAKTLINTTALKGLGILSRDDLYCHVYFKMKTADGFVATQTPAIDSTDSTAPFLYWPKETTYSDANGKREATFLIVINDEAETDAPAGYSKATSGEFSLDGVLSFVYHQPKVQNASSTTVTAASYSFSTTYGERLYAKGCSPYAYRYSDLRNFYIVKVQHPIIEGFVSYLQESIGAKFASLLQGNELYVPFIFSTQYMTLAQIMICAATPWIAKVRMNSFKDVLYLEDNVGFYPYSKLISLKDSPFKNYTNFIFKDYDSPLETKIMDPVRAISWVMPEFFWKVGTRKYVGPWYTNECDLLATGDVNDDAATMSMPSIRSGYKLGVMDTLYGMSEKDLRLSLDRIAKTFFRSSKIGHFGAYKYGRTTDGQIFITLNNGQTLTVGDLLSAPRELGLYIQAPLGYLTPDPDDNSLNAFAGTLKDLTNDGTATSFRIRVWRNPNATIDPSILAASGVNITRAANYTQSWFELTANGATSNTQVGGLVFGMNDEGAATYKPFAALGTGAEDTDYAETVESLQRSINTRLQYLPFAISPFDAVTTSGASAPRDIYDICYYFGLAGFRASDYRESVYNREKEVVNQGMLFVEDPWVMDSPIVREGSKSTGLVLTKGYSIR